MKQKNKYFPIKTIKDWELEDWDIYFERKSKAGIMIYQGWPYGLTPRDGIGGQFSYILTAEIAEYLKNHSISEVESQLGLSNSIVAKFRRKLGIQNKFIYRDDQWLLEHKNELLYDSLETLRSKYGLKRSQVYQHRKWLSELIEIPARKKIRKIVTDDHREQWFLENKSKMINMTVKEIATNFEISTFLAKKAYNSIREELGELNFSQQIAFKKQSQHQWLIEHQKELLDSEKSIADLAKLFGKTEGQILRDRATLRKILKIKKLKDMHQAWLLANQEVLQDSSLKKEEIAQKLGIEPKQVYRKKGQLRKLLNQPHYNDLVQAWRLDNQDILLSLHLTISEIAQLLDRNERYIVKNRMILRKFLGITKQDQKRTWVLNHSHDLETLSIEELQQKYNLRHSIAKTYKRLLIELKQNENE